MPTNDAMPTVFDKEYWEKRWENRETGWDIGQASTPIVDYFDQVSDKSLKILIPGCGNAWEGEYLVNQGFNNVFLIDIASGAVEHIRKRAPHFPKEQIISGDFFELDMDFDIIVEQTFFCALDPSQRPAYAKQAHALLRQGGSLLGLLFDKDFGNDFPPFGGNKEEYLGYFSPYFNIEIMEPAYNSIKPRMGSELFIKLVKP